MTSHPRRFRSPHSQRGITLLIGLVMLLVITLIAANVFQLSTLNTRIVNNDQVRTEAASAAHSALDILLSTEVTTWAPYETGERVQVNLGNLAGVDAGSSETVAVVLESLQCKRSRVIKNAELVQGTAHAQYVAEADSHCFGGGGTPLTIVDTSAAGSPNDDSLCASVLYEVVARTEDPKLLHAQATITQGVEVRRGLNALNECD